MRRNRPPSVTKITHPPAPPRPPRTDRVNTTVIKSAAADGTRLRTAAVPSRDIAAADAEFSMQNSTSSPGVDGTLSVPPIHRRIRRTTCPTHPTP